MKAGSVFRASCEFPPSDCVSVLDNPEFSSTFSTQNTPLIRLFLFHSIPGLLRQILNTTLPMTSPLVERPSPRLIATGNFRQQHLMRSPICHSR